MSKNFGIKYFDLLDYLIPEDGQKYQINISGTDEYFNVKGFIIEELTEESINECREFFKNFNCANNYYTLHVRDFEGREVSTEDDPANEDYSNMDIFKLKKITSKYAKCRRVFISPTFDEVYGERYTNLTHSGKVSKFYFDYTALYHAGIEEYEPVMIPKNGELVETDFIYKFNKKDERGPAVFPASTDTMFRYTCCNVFPYVQGEDVYFGYTTRLNIKFLNSGVESFDYFDSFGNFVPASTLKPYVIMEVKKNG